MKLLELRMVRSGPQLKCGGPPKAENVSVCFAFYFSGGGALFSEREKTINWVYREVGRIWKVFGAI